MRNKDLQTYAALLCVACAVALIATVIYDRREISIAHEQGYSKGVNECLLWALSNK